jgi:predicted O-linked N-acetylglucosamine transferase (SPINDLY family)
LARAAHASEDPTVALEIYRAALAFDPHQGEALLAFVWDRYRAKDMPSALDYAERAVCALEHSPEATSTLGWIRWEAKLSEKAVETLAETVTRHPDYAIAHWYLGHMYSRLGRFSEAERLLRRAVDLAPDLEEATETLAWVLADSGRIDDALALAHDAARSRRTPESLALLGYLLGEKGEWDAALVLLETAFAGTPNDPFLRRHLAMALNARGRNGEARALIEAAIETSPDDRSFLLSLATLWREGGDRAKAELLAVQIVTRWPDWGEGWLLRGRLLLDLDKNEEALECVTKAQEYAPSLTAAVLVRSRILLKLNQAVSAAWLMECILAEAPDHADARAQLAWSLIRQRKSNAARAHLLVLLRKRPKAAGLWNALSMALHQMGRLLTARLAARRACRLAPENPDILRHAATLALEANDLETTSKLCHALLLLAPNLAATHILASFAHEASGRRGPAEQHAEQALFLAPTDAEAWRCLGHVRHGGKRLAEAEEAFHHAHALAPKRGDILGQLAWVLVADDRPFEALMAIRKACDLTPDSPDLWLERAEILGIVGRHEMAIEAIQMARKVLASAPGKGDALLARILLAQGLTTTEKRETAWRDAADLLEINLLRTPLDHGAATIALRLAAVRYAGAADLPRLIPRNMRRQALRELMEWLAAFGNAEEVMRVVDYAQTTFPRDTEIEISGHYLRVMAGGLDAGPMTRNLRGWALDHGMFHGQSAPKPMPLGVPGQPLRVAYLASHYHSTLLEGVLAAHDPKTVVLHLYTDDIQVLAPDLGSRVILHPLAETDLEASCAANRIDVVVDTVGVHPFHGQAKVLNALRRRLAPLQCGWLGAWGPSAGLFDLLLTDSTALPLDADGEHDETVLRLEGGQWAWTPPLVAPAVGPLPATKHRGVTFGCCVRGFRLSRDCLEAWADLLAAVPTSRFHLVGRHAMDWEFRSRFSDFLKARGVSLERVTYHFHRSYEEYLRTYGNIDIALDSFPANGGLCLLDALWMGVPVVTLAGKGPMAERQGASILGAANCSEWVAHNRAEYIEIAQKLAEDRPALTLLREGLRARLSDSPLLDARRVAAQMEVIWQNRRAEISEIRMAADLKTRCRTIAKSEICAWLARGHRLMLPNPTAPNISVVIVLYNQAGLSLRMLKTLADQDGISFETIIVDNDSQDETSDLLDRIDGATILRNDDNQGFLLAANQGAAVARGRHILFLNNDAYPHRDALTIQA